MIEALGIAIADRMVGEERGEAAQAGSDQGARPADIEEGFLLPGEAGIRQILGGCAAAHGDGGVGKLQSRRQLGIGRKDFPGQLVGNAGGKDQFADGAACILRLASLAW